MEPRVTNEFARGTKGYSRNQAAITRVLKESWCKAIYLKESRISSVRI